EPVRRQLLWTVLLSTLIFAAVVAWVCRWWSLHLARSLGEVTRVVEDIGGNTRVFLAENDLLAPLGRSINRISERLATRIWHLEEDRQQLRTILSGMVEGVVALDRDQRILFANERAGALLGLPALTEGGAEVQGRPLWEVVRQRSLIDVVRRALD